MIKPLTSLRFIFALMVFVSHLSFLEGSQSIFLRWIFDAVFYEGYIGVTFFFILSGFIIAYNYQDRIIKSRNQRKTFYIARIARIIPLHIITFIIAIPLTYKVFVDNKMLWLIQVFTNFSLTQSYIPVKSIYFSFNAPSWSISVELFFYFVFPWLILLLHKIKHLRNYLMLGIILAIPLLTFVIPVNYYHHLFYIHPFFRLADFLIGILLYNIYKYISIERLRGKFNLIEIFSILILILFFIYHKQISDVARYSYYYWIPMSLLIFTFSFQKGIISQFLSKKIFIHLGEISFGFYMVHQLVIKYSLIINSKLMIFQNEFWILLISFSISLIVSHFSFIWFEKPMNSYVKRVLKGETFKMCKT